MGHAQRKLDLLERAKQLLLTSDMGMTPTQLAKALHVNRATAHRYLAELSVRNNGTGVYFYEPTNLDVKLANLVLSHQKRK